MNILDPQGPIAAAEKTILIDSVAIMLAIVIPTIIAIFAFAYWFRQSNPRARYQPDWEYSGRIELVVWSIPTLTIILLGGVAWIGAHQLDPAKPVEGTGSPIRIQAVSLDWKWLFIYPDLGIATVNTLTVPAGAPLHFELTSGSVMNAFFIPQLGSIIYTMNGMVTRLELRADNEGTYQGLSAHFSGDGFPDMLFDVHVISQLAFPDWVASTARSNQVLNTDSYTALAQQSVPKDKPTYRLDDPRLFDAIATQKIPPGPGPQLTDNLAKPANGAANVR
ncbi:ubiquinol oxidase subunit II [Bradyrhizobium canariense]|uniref:Ubiquinol oxidase subunit 2 n=1 Tax=Bradyrhizobium canariense TaxID=255045 RepID=A0A1H1RR69_9BRAD|nr:ubiquinol oxidase subunit II [Bradyrhizobium canariense]SDS38046.1 cytochrome o ubiquinol oxidase subunit 2 [Bradyrhizobium canariense]